jgi:hypothetical protein
VIFGDDDRENEELLGFDLDNIELEAQPTD